MDNKGYVYALINPSLQGLVKVGFTTNEPEHRAKELSSATGVPTPYLVAYKEFFSDCKEAEKQVHQLLEEKETRINPNREFFEVELSEVVRVINLVKQSSPLSTQSSTKDDIQSHHDDIAELLFEEGLAYLNGDGDFFQNTEIGLEKLEKSLKLKNTKAAQILSKVYLEGDLVRQDLKKAMRYSEQQISIQPSCEAYLSLARCYAENQNLQNTLKALFFALKNAQDSELSANGFDIFSWIYDLLTLNNYHLDDAVNNPLNYQDIFEKVFEKEISNFEFIDYENFERIDFKRTQIMLFFADEFLSLNPEAKKCTKVLQIKKFAESANEEHLSKINRENRAKEEALKKLHEDFGYTYIEGVSPYNSNHPDMQRVYRDNNRKFSKALKKIETTDFNKM